MTARIYRPAKTAMQSGRGGEDRWLLEFAPESANWVEPLMGWTASRDTRRQVRLAFASREAAEAYAERAGLAYQVEEAAARRLESKSYADNFRFDRVQRWTH